jgi:hypothetical protein
MAQKLNDMASSRPSTFEMAQREFNDRQMLLHQPTQPTMQQQQQTRIEPTGALPPKGPHGCLVPR